MCGGEKKGRRWRIYVDCCASLHYGFVHSIAMLAVRLRSKTSRASAFSLDGLSSLRAPRTPRRRRRKSSKGVCSRAALRVRLRPGGPRGVCFLNVFASPSLIGPKIAIFGCLGGLFAIATSPMSGRVPDAERPTSKIAERYAFSL